MNDTDKKNNDDVDIEIVNRNMRFFKNYLKD
jgi:hypothetical protein